MRSTSTKKPAVTAPRPARRPRGRFPDEEAAQRFAPPALVRRELNGRKTPPRTRTAAPPATCCGMTTARGLRPFCTTIFTEMSALRPPAPAYHPRPGRPPPTRRPREIVDAVTAAIRSVEANQYAPRRRARSVRRYRGPSALLWASSRRPRGVQSPSARPRDCGDDARAAGPGIPADEVSSSSRSMTLCGDIAMAGATGAASSLRPPDFASLDLDELADAAAAGPGFGSPAQLWPHHPYGSAS